MQFFNNLTGIAKRLKTIYYQGIREQNLRGINVLQRYWELCQ